MAESFALKCPSCSSLLQAQDFDYAKGLATCSHCHALITLPGQSAAGAPMQARPQVPAPKRLILRQTMGGIEIVRRWFTADVLMMVIFCIVWDSFLFHWYTNPKLKHTDSTWLPYVFPLGHLAVGIGLTYLTVANLFNTTRIAVDRGLVTVTHGPIPWRGQISVVASEIDQLYCKEKESSGRKGWTRYSYEVWSVLRDGSSERLVAAGVDKDQALFIEQEVERALNIQPQCVPGEMRM